MRFKNGIGPLHLACEYCHIELVQLLLLHGADVNQMANVRHKYLVYLSYASLTFLMFCQYWVRMVLQCFNSMHKGS